ncbi:MAG TPA: T9SS type A sorting domain-containing protein [Flavobacteriaceae bacterium]|nr:T9SS type A sorting domain-containing protein [Flavobacteriaceae bacterium]
MKKITFLILTILPFIGFGQNLAPNPTLNGSTDWSDLNAGTTQAYDGTFTRTADGSGSWIINSNGTFNSGIKSSNISGLAAGDYIFSYYVYGNAGDITKPIIRDNGISSNIQGATYTIQADNTWELVEQSFTISGAGTVNLRAMVNSDDGLMDFYVDEFSFVSSNSIIEDLWVTNPNFEATTNWTDNGSEASSTYVTSAPYEGSQNLMITFNTDQTTNFTVDNDIYDFGETVAPSEINTTFWVKASSTAIQIQVNFDIYDAAGVKITGNNTGVINLSAANTWQEVTFTKPITNTFNQIVYRLKVKQGALSGDTVEFDQVSASFTYFSLGTETFLTNDNSFSVYPNPAKNVINIKGNNNLSNVSVYDLTGKKVISQNNLINNKLDVTSLNSGIYLLNLKTDKGAIITKKIVVE